MDNHGKTAIFELLLCWGFLALTGNAIVGMVIGLPLFFIPVYYFLLRKDMSLYRLTKMVHVEEY